MLSCSSSDNATPDPKTPDKTFKVSFNVNTPSNASASDIKNPPTEQTIKEGNTATEPPAPTLTGYTFAGWFREVATTNQFTFTTKITKDTTLYAKWNINTYTVNFDVDGGSLVDAIENISHNTSITKPTNPTKEGHTFVNWFKDTAKTQIFNFTTETITANITLYAKWETATTYSVMFDVDGGSPVEAIENIPQNTSITKPTDPTKANNTFVNWFKDSTKTMVFDFSSETITADITLYAKWEIATTYTVMFNVDGGSPVEAIENIPNNTSITKPTDPTKTNSRFVNWFKDTAKTMVFDFATETITANITLYAKWEVVNANTFTVTFNLNYTDSMPIVRTVNSGTTATRETPTRTNFNFVDWYENEDLTGTPFDFATEISADKNLYAKWETITYTITFNLNYTDSTPITQTVNSGTTATREMPTRTNYNFIDWFENENLTGTPFDFTTEISADKNLYAKWEIITYTVMFNLNYTPSTPITQTVNSGTIATRETPTRPNFNFIDWFENENLTGTPFDFTTEISADKNLYAKWTSNPVVTFNTLGGSVIASQTIEGGVLNAPNPSPTRTHYTLEGWYENEQFTGSKVTFPKAISTNKTLYAKWTRIAYTITFDLNYLNAPSGDTVDSNQEGKVSKPNPSIGTGYTFVGWFIETTGDTQINLGTHVFKSAMTLYAHWSFSITFNENYGDNPAEEIVQTNPIDHKVSKADPTRTRYIFKGWYTDKNIFNIKIDLNIHVFDAPITLYASWENIYISFFSNYLNSPSSVSVSLNGEGKISSNHIPLNQKSRSGYVLVGWFTEPTGGTKIDLDTYVFTTSINLYARWRRVYRVAFDLNYVNAPAGGTADSNQEGKVSKADPTRTRYTFNGWFTADTGGTKVELAEKVFDAPITLYAQWTRIVYTIRFDLNYVNAPDGGTVNTNQEGKVSKPNPARPSYTFNGWFTEDIGGTKVELTLKVFDSATTLYAQWRGEGKANILSVSITAVASSIQLSITSSLALSDIGAVIRLASESAPTKTEAMASVGYVALTVPVNEARKFSISQHYGSDFTDGITLADVLSTNTAYKLYLYFPANSISTATTEITGISITDDIGEATFTTASLPAEGDAIWTSQWTAKKYVSSLDNLYYMEAQKGVVVVYFKVPFALLYVEVSSPLMKNSEITGTMATFSANTPNPKEEVYFNYATITGYSPSYGYWIIAEKEVVINEKILRTAFTNREGIGTIVLLSVTRY